MIHRFAGYLSCSYFVVLWILKYDGDHVKLGWAFIPPLQKSFRHLCCLISSLWFHRSFIQHIILYEVYVYVRPFHYSERLLICIIHIVFTGRTNPHLRLCVLHVKSDMYSWMQTWIQTGVLSLENIVIDSNYCYPRAYKCWNTAPGALSLGPCGCSVPRSAHAHHLP